MTQVTIRNAGHNLFMTTPRVPEIMHAFMRGEPIAEREIEVPAPDFTVSPNLGG